MMSVKLKNSVAIILLLPLSPWSAWQAGKEMAMTLLPSKDLWAAL